MSNNEPCNCDQALALGHIMTNILCYKASGNDDYYQSKDEIAAQFAAWESSEDACNCDQALAYGAALGAYIAGCNGDCKIYYAQMNAMRETLAQYEAPPDKNKVIEYMKFRDYMDAKIADGSL